MVAASFLQSSTASSQSDLSTCRCVQVPLQPLMNDLESQTYEIFEKDVTKYIAYENAIHQALIERHASGREASTSGSSAQTQSDEPPVHIMVVGAGRGPLVRASLRAGMPAKPAPRCLQPHAAQS